MPARQRVRPLFTHGSSTSPTMNSTMIGVTPRRWASWFDSPKASEANSPVAKAMASGPMKLVARPDSA